MLPPGTEDVRFAAKVKHLQGSFPAAPEEEVAAALLRAASNPLPAKKVCTRRPTGSAARLRKLKSDQRCL